jgi:Family of unknown function (DUF6184)
MTKRSASFGYTLLIAAMAIAPAVLSGCERDQAPATMGNGTQSDAQQGLAGRAGVGEAVDQIAQARCTRAAACNRFGPGKEYADRDACTTRIKSSLRGELSATECPAGIDRKELGECLEEIRNENCDNPLDQLGRLVACRSSDMCLN